MNPKQNHSIANNPSFQFLQGEGEMTTLIRNYDWASTPIGPVENWPAALKISVSTILASPFPMYIGWGPQFTQLYNDAYRPILGTTKHPQALGASPSESFAEIWDTVKPLLDGVMQGVPVRNSNMMFTLNRHGYKEDCYFDFAYSPIPDENGVFGGVLVTLVETTEKQKDALDLKNTRDELLLANEALATQGDKLKGFFMQAPGGICILDGPDFVFELVNPTYQSFFPGRQLLGKTVLEALPELKDQPIAGILRDVYHNDKMFEGRDLKVPFARTEGGPLEDRYFNFVYQPRHNAKGETDGILVFVYEVTDAMMVKLSLEESEKRFRSMVEQSPVPMLITRGERMIFEEVNAPMLELIGRDESVKGKPAYEIMPELQGQPVMQQLYNCYHSGETWTGHEQPILIKRAGKQLQGYYNVSYKPLYENGIVTGVLQSAIDVTEQVNARTSLEKAEDTLKLSLLAARLGTFDLDFEKSVLDWDDRCRVLFGISHSNEVTYEKDFVEGLHPEDRERILKTINEHVLVKEKSNGHYDVEYRTVGAEDKKVRWLRAMGKAYFDDYDRPVRFIGSVLDITESKEDELRKNDFIAMVSHELKTPLTSVKGYVQLSQHEASSKGNTFVAGILEKADNHLKKMNDLINAFLNVSRFESGKITLNKQLFCLDDLAKEIIDDTNLIATGHQIAFKPCDPLNIYADRDKIGSVISNLLSNATKYSKKNSTIEVRCIEDEGRIGISVQDQGIGIKAEHVNKLFERYYRVETLDSHTISGFGIGLYLSAEIVNRHGGQIGVESKPGQGSRFYFMLPKQQLS